MNANKVLLAVVPALLVVGVVIGMNGAERVLATIGRTEAQRLTLSRAGIALPFAAAAAVGVTFLFATAGSASIRSTSAASAAPRSPSA